MSGERTTLHAGPEARRFVVRELAPWRRLAGLVLTALGVMALMAGDFDRLPARLVFGLVALVAGLLLMTAMRTVLIEGETRSVSSWSSLLFFTLRRIDLPHGRVSLVVVEWAARTDAHSRPARVVKLSRSLGRDLLLRRSTNAAIALQTARRAAELLGTGVSDHTGARRRFRGDGSDGLPTAPLDPVAFEALVGRVSCIRRDGELRVEVGASNSLDTAMLMKLLGTFVPAGVGLAVLAERYGVNDLTLYAVAGGFAFMFLPIAAFIVWSWLRLKTRWTLAATGTELVLLRKRLGTRTFRIPVDELVIEEGVDPGMTPKGARPCLVVSHPRGVLSVGVGLDRDELELLADRTTQLLRIRQLSAA